MARKFESITFLFHFPALPPPDISLLAISNPRIYGTGIMKDLGGAISRTHASQYGREGSSRGENEIFLCQLRKDAL